MSLRTVQCPGCGGNKFEGGYVLPAQPVILNYRFESVTEAKKVRRADLELTRCVDCGLVFNALFVAELVPYDSKYENTQTHSPVFTEYLEKVARSTNERHQLHGKRVLEVGCGKGNFLKLLCEIGHCEGVGYDTTYEGPPEIDRPRVRFFTRYLTAEDVTSKFDVVVCRHVIEHVPAIGEFLRELHLIARACGEPMVMLETPRFEWIVENDAFWDVFYEHCNYFTEDALNRLCVQAGFEVRRQEPSFGGQYQILELGVDGTERVDGAGAPGRIDLRGFGARVGAQQSKLVERLKERGAEEGWAIWGAGAKGVALVNQLRFEPPVCVIDINPAKQGCYISGSAVPIVAPDDRRPLESRVILVSNPNYLEEIQRDLIRLGYRNAVIAL